MAITAKMVKELRTRTGAGMMDCKKALVECDGDIDSAMEFLQKKGIAKAGKKSGRIAAEGLVAIHVNDDATSATLIEVNCETDFVARNEAFQSFVQGVAALAHNNGLIDVDALLGIENNDGTSVEEWTKKQISNIGENIKIRRLARLEGDHIGAYTHAGSQIGVIVKTSISGAAQDTAAEFSRNIAMHVAASNPQYATPDEIDQNAYDKHKEILTAQALDSGKPANIVEKMVVGRMRKWTAEVTLVKQPYVKDPDLTVEKYQKKTGGIAINSFIRFQVGEGIEKVVSNLADEVAAQINA